METTTGTPCTPWTRAVVQSQYIDYASRSDGLSGGRVNPLLRVGHQNLEISHPDLHSQAPQATLLFFSRVTCLSFYWDATACGICCKKTCYAIGPKWTTCCHVSLLLSVVLPSWPEKAFASFASAVRACNHACIHNHTVLTRGGRYCQSNLRNHIFPCKKALRGPKVRWCASAEHVWRDNFLIRLLLLSSRKWALMKCCAPRSSCTRSSESSVA